MKNKKVLTLCTVIALGLGTAACSGNQEAAGTQSQSQGEQTTEEQLSRADADLVIWCDNNRAPIIEEYAETFGQAHGLTVKVQVAGDVRGQFSTAAKVGKGPDIVVGAHDWLGGFVQNGMVRPLNIDAGTEALFSEVAMDGAKFEGKTYGLPYAVENIALIRNTDLAPDAPESIDQMLEQGNTLMEAGSADRILVQEVSKSGNAYYAYPYLSAYGGGIFAQDESGQFDPNRVIVDSEESKKGGELLARLGKEGVLSTNISGDNSMALFTEGRTPYLISGPWAIESITNAGINYEISPLPTVPDGGRMQPFVGIQLFYVSANASNPAVAEEFLLGVLPNKELQIDLYKVGHRAPALKSALDAVSTSDPDISAWAEAGQDALPMPNIPAMNSVWGPLGQATADVIAGVAEPGPRFDAAAEEIRDAIARSNE